MDQIAANYASPLTVEGAHASEQIGALVRLALRRIFTIIFPAVAVLAIISPWLLRAFGEKYASAAPLLCILLIACLPKAVSTVYYAYCRVQRVTHRSAGMQACICIATLSAVVLLAHSFGLISIGLAILAVQASAGAVSWMALRSALRAVDNRDARQGRHRQRRGGGLES